MLIKMFAATLRSRRHLKVRTSIHSWEATSSSIRSTADQVPAMTGWLSRKTSRGGRVLSQPASRQAPGSRHLASAAAAAMSSPPSGAASMASARRTSSEASRSTEGSQARRSSNSVDDAEPRIRGHPGRPLLAGLVEQFAVVVEAELVAHTHRARSFRPWLSTAERSRAGVPASVPPNP